MQPEGKQDRGGPEQKECPKAGEVRIKKLFQCVQAWAVGPAFMAEVRAIVVRVELSM